MQLSWTYSTSAETGNAVGMTTTKTTFQQIRTWRKTHALCTEGPQTSSGGPFGSMFSFSKLLYVPPSQSGLARTAG